MIEEVVFSIPSSIPISSIRSFKASASSASICAVLSYSPLIACSTVSWGKAASKLPYYDEDAYIRRTYKFGGGKL